jgi:ribosomal protein S12 methylthiotransferase accessory factor
MAGANEVLVTLPGGRRVDAQLGAHVVRTDQPIENGGEDTAPSPYQLFLAALGTCAGIFVQGFCAKRGLSTEGIRIRERPFQDPETGTLARVELDIEVPPEFPEKYREALIRVVDQCSVKRAIQAQPTFETRTVVRET